MRNVLRLLICCFVISIFVVSCGGDSGVSSVTGPDETDAEGNDPHEISGITFITIPSGTFRMGDLQNFGENENELPVHEVTISSFEMSMCEITNAQYATFLTKAYSAGEIDAESASDDNDDDEGYVIAVSGNWSGYEYIDIETDNCHISYSSGSFYVKSDKKNHPVQGVSWYGAKAFAEYYGFDLPTEAEWEYACRAGTETEFYTGNNLSSDGTTSTDLDAAGWYLGNSDTEEEYPFTHEVGQKEPNNWGLYDMHGNVWEWCNDWYDSEYYASSPSNDPTGPETGTVRVRRGGSWGHNAVYGRSAIRFRYKPDYMTSYVGFRVVSR